MTERKVKLDRANKSILLRALGDVYYSQRARGGSAEVTGRLIGWQKQRSTNCAPSA